jgi:flagellar hook-associated protein 1 FlgK
LQVTQNNVTNASTPGYARQRMSLQAEWFDPEHGLPGGVAIQDSETSRKFFAERAVWRQNALSGRFEELATAMGRIEGNFDATGTSGVPLAMRRLFDSFSQWSVSPNDVTSRRLVIDRAGDLAREIRTADKALAAEHASALDQVQNTLSKIGELSQVVATYNIEVRRLRDAGSDPGLDAQVHVALEELSEMADIDVRREQDGTFTVLLGGEAALVLAEKTYPLSEDFDGTNLELRDAQGNTITTDVSAGRLKAQLDLANSLVPGWRGQLDMLAASLADTVNATLVAGLDQNQIPGAALFSYDASNAAGSIEVANILPEQLAAASNAAPGGNGNALDLAALGNTPQIEGMTYAAWYGGVASEVGREAASAKENGEGFRSLLVQAREVRKQESGVSLDEEAVRLIELQRAYQATARLVTVLDSLTETTLNMLR